MNNMGEPSELSLFEIRKFMIENGCKVTNHALVKHFKNFLTNTEKQNESRKQFKTFVNILATIKTENNEKFLVLRKKYLTECPSEEVNITGGGESSSSSPMSPGSISLSDSCSSLIRDPPPYKSPPDVLLSSNDKKISVLQHKTKENYRDCINEFENALNKLDLNRSGNDESQIEEDIKFPMTNRSVSCEKVVNENIENVKISGVDEKEESETESVNVVSVKEAARKFNRLASEEEAKIISPSNKKKIEKVANEEKLSSEVTMAHPKAKEWVVSAAKANYQELAKLAQEYPELVKLQDPTAGYTALHWAAKHGNEDIIKLIAGTYKANVDCRTNGGYTPLHISMQFGRDSIFELLCNVYKANRDLLDWSGNKALDYRKQKRTVSASTYSKIREKRRHAEKELGFLRIGSLNVRVRKTTEAFSNFLGVGNNSSSTANNQTQQFRSVDVIKPNLKTTTSRANMSTNSHDFDKIHKNWGSADNIPHSRNCMPPPKSGVYYSKKRKSKRASNDDSNGYNSMPSTPNQIRAPIGIPLENSFSNIVNVDSDSDSAYGFDSSWSTDKLRSQFKF